MISAKRRLTPRIPSRLAFACPQVLGVAHGLSVSVTECLKTGKAGLTERAFTTIAALLPRPSRDRRNILSGSASRDGKACLISVTSYGRAHSVKATAAHGASTVTPAIPAFSEIRELARHLRVKPRTLFKSLGGYLEKKKHRIVLSGVPYAFPKLGNVIVPFQDARAVAKILGKEIRFLDVDKRPDLTSLVAPSSLRSFLRDDEQGSWQGRRPVVVLLGHFNHGKTTILDALLGSSSGMAEREIGGITQEIRARTVSLYTEAKDNAIARVETAMTAPSLLPEETNVSRDETDGASTSTFKLLTEATFLDTPGQEIFYRMRTNGARVADAVVLVVSAVDGVCLQTSESIGCAEELGLPIVVAINKIDLLPGEDATQRLNDLSMELREFVAVENSQVLPVSGITGRGIDDLRASIAVALGKHQPHSEHPQDTRNPDLSVMAVRQKESPASIEAVQIGDGAGGATGGSGNGVPKAARKGDLMRGIEVVVAEAPDDAATATVLDYTSSAKAGKVLLVLVDRGILRPGDSFVSGMLWGVVRSIYDEKGDQLLKHAGPGVAAKVVFQARTPVPNALLGEPFRVLTNEAAEKVAHVRALASTIDNFIDHWRVEREFAHLMDNEEEDDEPGGCADDTSNGRETYSPEVSRTVNGNEDEDCAPDEELTDASEERLKRWRQGNDEEEYLNAEDMPVTIVVKADSANTLASILDALGDWGDIDRANCSRDSHSEGSGYGSHAAYETICAGDLTKGNDDGHEEGRVLEESIPTSEGWGRRDQQHNQRRRLVVSVARSGIGAVTSSDVLVARDCECPVFAHNVKTDATATKELKRVGGAVIPALSEGVVRAEKAVLGVGGKEGFIGKAGEGRGCVVVSETVGELLGEIERFVLRVR